MSRDKRDAERAARRAKRLAERAEERARRAERQAERAAERADRLADEVNRRPRREKDLERSIEDLVDEVTQKAERWIDEHTSRIFDSVDEDTDIRRAENRAEKAKREAEKARREADRAEQAAERMTDYEESLDSASAAFEERIDDNDDSRSRRARRRARKARRRSAWGFVHVDYDWPGRSRARAAKRRSPHLYRDRERGKLCGVCAGVADYFGRPAWEMRLYAVLGLVFIPSVTFPAYFLAYFLMDDKPYYRRVTDRFQDDLDTDQDDSNHGYSGAGAGAGAGSGKASGQKRQPEVAKQREPVMSNVQAMKKARDKFSDIEQRLRQMEGHVTSSRFELQRELRKISGED